MQWMWFNTVVFFAGFVIGCIAMYLTMESHIKCAMNYVDSHKAVNGAIFVRDFLRKSKRSVFYITRCRRTAFSSAAFKELQKNGFNPVLVEISTVAQLRDFRMRIIRGTRPVLFFDSDAQILLDDKLWDYERLKQYNVEFADMTWPAGVFEPIKKRGFVL